MSKVELNKEVKLCITEFVNNIKKYIENPEEQSPLNANKEIINKINSDEYAYLAFTELRKQLLKFNNELFDTIKEGKMSIKEFKHNLGMLMIISLFVHNSIGEVYFFNEGYIGFDDGSIMGQEILFRRYYLDLTGFGNNRHFNYLIADVQRIMNNFSARAVDFTNFRIKQCIHLGEHINDTKFVKNSLIQYMKPFRFFYNELKSIYEKSKEDDKYISWMFSIVNYLSSIFNDVITEKIKL